MLATPSTHELTARIAQGPRMQTAKLLEGLKPGPYPRAPCIVPLGFVNVLFGKGTT